MKLLGDISLKGYKSFYSARERKELGIKTGTPSHPLESLHSRRSKSPKQREEFTNSAFGSSRLSSRNGPFPDMPKADRIGPGNYPLSLLRTQNTFKHFKYTNQA